MEAITDLQKEKARRWEALQKQFVAKYVATMRLRGPDPSWMEYFEADQQAHEEFMAAHEEERRAWWSVHGACEREAQAEVDCSNWGA